MKNTSYQILCGLTILILFSGCAGTFAPPERWVDDNFLYSTKAPRLTIKVDDSFIYSATDPEIKITDSTKMNIRGGMKTEWYKFRDRSKRRMLNIKISTLDQGRIYMSLPNYSKWKGVISYKTESLNNENYYTGIMADKEDFNILYKAFGKVVGDLVRYQIFYIEQVDEDWTNKDFNLLTTEEISFLREFENRANNSFSVQPYRSGLQNNTHNFKKKNTFSSIESDPFPNINIANIDSVLTKSYVISEIKNSDFESRLINEKPEMALCFSLTRSDTIRVLSGIKDQVTDDSTRGLPNVLNGTDISAVKNSVYFGTLAGFFRNYSDKFNINYLSPKNKKRCSEFFEKHN